MFKIPMYLLTFKLNFLILNSSPYMVEKRNFLKGHKTLYFFKNFFTKCVQMCAEV